MKIQYKNLKIFGPAVLKVRIPDEIIKKLNDYIDEVVKDENKSKNLNLGESLAGDVTQEFYLENEFAKSCGWLDFIANCTNIFIEINEGKKIKNFNLMRSWVVRQFQNEYNPVHWHSGHISGAGFLKLPETFGKHTQDKQNKEYHGGKLELIHGTRQFLSDSVFKITPEVGDFYLFPHYMMHTVYPFKNTKDERRSISFNAKVDEEAFNVY